MKESCCGDGVELCCATWQLVKMMRRCGAVLAAMMCKAELLVWCEILCAAKRKMMMLHWEVDDIFGIAFQLRPKNFVQYSKQPPKH